MPAGMTHEEHLAQMKKDAEMKERGAEAMGFDQDTTTHHFRLTQARRAHRGQRERRRATSPGAMRFARTSRRSPASSRRGTSRSPFMTHAEVPPGVETMKRLGRQDPVRVRPDRAAAGIVRIETDDAAARAAVHAFLRYQITEHATGDADRPK